jgi:hypothetical protein
VLITDSDRHLVKKRVSALMLLTEGGARAAHCSIPPWAREHL